MSVGGYVGASVHSGRDELYNGYIELLQDRVFDPIGMNTAVVRVSDARRDPNYGLSYRVRNRRPVAAVPPDFDGDALAPSGSVKANVKEMAAYVQTHLNGGVAPSGAEVVSPANMAVLHQPIIGGYALGWQTSVSRGVEVFSHEGAFDNYLSVIGFVPELDLGFVILTNSEDAGETLIGEGPRHLIQLVAAAND